MTSLWRETAASLAAWCLCCTTQRPPIITLAPTNGAGSGYSYDKDVRKLRLAPQSPRDFEAIQSRHAKIENNHVRAESRFSSTIRTRRGCVDVSESSVCS
jgi:hypothetical protein